MGGILNRRRPAAPASGVASVGDAWACTNPSLGRGMALGLIHVAAPDGISARVRAALPAAMSRDADSTAQGWEVSNVLGLFVGRRGDAVATGTVAVDGETLVDGSTDNAEMETLEDLNFSWDPPS
jgi:hypothetical protein